MNLGQLADTLVASAKKFRNEKLIAEIVPLHKNKRLTDKIVSEILSSYLTLLENKLPIEIQYVMQKKLSNFIPLAVKQIHRDSHMNDADGTDTLTQNNAEAILVAFINHACVPLDLALYTRNLIEN